MSISPSSLLPAVGSSAAPTGREPLPNPQALLFFLAHPDSYRRPLFSRKEVFCGPDAVTRVAGGRTFALKTPTGSFCVTDVLKQLPPEQKPEVVIVKADATGRILPRNLSKLGCPKVLIVGDTHHLQTPIQTLLRYASEEQFDHIVFDHTRHHAHWFAEAGFRQLAWIPAIDFGFLSRPLNPNPQHRLTFAGQAGRYHPYRRWVLDQVRQAGLPLETFTGTLSSTADIYADSEITLNISLNGDLNLRVFEALAAGGFLLTDELSPESGLSSLFESGRHLVTWKSPAELIEKVRYYLDHPAEAHAIRAAGQAELIRSHHPEVKLRQFFDLVFNHRLDPRCDLSTDARILRVPRLSADARLPGFARTVQAYEALQELHRGSPAITVFASERTLPVVSGLADLPRLHFQSLDSTLVAGDVAQNPADEPGSPVHVLFWDEAAKDSGTLGDALSGFLGSHVICLTEEDYILREHGFTPISGDSIIFRLTDVKKWMDTAWEAGRREAVRARLQPQMRVVQNSAECLALAEFAGALEDKVLYKAGLQRAIALDRGNQSALIQFAAVAMDADELASACLLLEEAARVAPLPEQLQDIRSQLTLRTIEIPIVENYFRATGRLPIEPTEPKRSILLVTNLFPPQELGGYGRMMWEFAHGLRARGHDVHILTGDAPYLSKPKSIEEAQMEGYVDRRLQLTGSWANGSVEPLTDAKKIAVRVNANTRRILDAAREFKADFVLAGNLDFIGAQFLHEALNNGIPVLHALANAMPGYPLEQQPSSPLYWVAPCSDWNGSVFREAGYGPGRIETLYPGARVDRFYRFFTPDLQTLRICYASLVMPYKGAHVLVKALAHLQQMGVPFTAEIAGDSTDPEFLEKLKAYTAEMGMEDKVSFPGFLDRAGLHSLFGRNNVLVFPSQFAEPFGISQVEALAAGLVVVTSGTGGAREIIRDRVDGLQFNAPDAADLAEKLKSLYLDGALFSQLQQAAPMRAFEFSVDAAVAKIERLGSELLAAKAGL